MRELVYLNGTFLPLQEAHVSVLDRGFLFGDGVYEVIPSVNQRFFKLEEHMQRLKRSLEATAIPMPTLDFEAIFQECQTLNNSQDDAIYVQITRGADADRALLPSYTSKPTVFVASISPLIHSIEEARAGIRAITTPDMRWQNCHIKAITLLPNAMARITADNQQASEAIMIKDNFVTEGSSSNVFIVKNKVIRTPPESLNILGGITRQTIIELASINKLSCKEENISEEDLASADEIWVTSSTRGITPVVSLNAHIIGTGKAGPIWEIMTAILEQHAKVA